MLDSHPPLLIICSNPQGLAFESQTSHGHGQCPAYHASTGPSHTCLRVCVTPRERNGPGIPCTGHLSEGAHPRASAAESKRGVHLPPERLSILWVVSLHPCLLLFRVISSVNSLSGFQPLILQKQHQHLLLFPPSPRGPAQRPPPLASAGRGKSPESTHMGCRTATQAQEPRARAGRQKEVTAAKATRSTAPLSDPESNASPHSSRMGNDASQCLSPHTALPPIPTPVGAPPTALFNYPVLRTRKPPGRVAHTLSLICQQNPAQNMHQAAEHCAPASR